MARTSIGSNGNGGAGSGGQMEFSSVRGSAPTPTSSSSLAAGSSDYGHLIHGGHHERDRRIPPSTTPPSRSRLDFVDSDLSLEGDELMRQLSMVERKDFEHLERVNGRTVNIVQGLELHAGVFSPLEHKKIVDCVYHYQEKGRQHRLRGQEWEPAWDRPGRGGGSDPFCTVSFLAECSIVFGTDLRVAGPGKFSGPVAIPLPVCSVLVLNGNGAEVAKHCVPAVPCKRISIAFRKMDQRRVPCGFAPDSELPNLRPLSRSSPRPRPLPLPAQPEARNAAAGVTPFTLGNFPPRCSAAKPKRSLRQ